MRAHDEGREERRAVEGEVGADREGDGSDEEEGEGAPDAGLGLVVDDD